MPWRLTTENRCRLCRIFFVPGEIATFLSTCRTIVATRLVHILFNVPMLAPHGFFMSVKLLSHHNKIRIRNGLQRQDV
jgi:hypothetical protein